MGKLDGKVAVITGAASGMGRATAVRFAREGAAVVVADLDSPAGEATISEITAAGGSAVFQYTDVGSEADLKALFDRALKEYGRLDITYNNAGIGGATGRLTDVTADDWDRTFIVLTRAVFLGIKYSIEPMRKIGGGSIISTASVAGVSARRRTAWLLCGQSRGGEPHSKRGYRTRPDRIRVNCICPGESSPRSFYRHMRGGEEQARRQYRRGAADSACRQPRRYRRDGDLLASDEAEWVTGTAMVVDGGMNTGNARANFAPGFSGPSFQRPDRTNQPPRPR